MCRLLCIDSANRPKEIPKNKWITKDMEYTAIWITIHPEQNNIQGVQLAEISLDETCFPYETFKLSRFAINAEDFEEFLQLAKDCSEVNIENLEELLKEEVHVL
jgi:hypothetical protein